MNAAAKLLNHHSVLSRGWVASVMFARIQFGLFALIFGVLTSALSLIYVTHTEHNLNANIQQSLLERDQMHVQRSELLLEKSSLTSQTRVQRIAEAQLEMASPEGNDFVVVEEK